MGKPKPVATVPLTERTLRVAMLNDNYSVRDCFRDHYLTDVYNFLQLS